MCSEQYLLSNYSQLECGAKPSMLMANWALGGGRNYSHIYIHLWTKVHQIKYACMAWMYFAMPFLTDDILLLSRDTSSQVAKL